MCLRMMYSFPTEVVVTMEKVEDHPSPPEEFRKKMMPAVRGNGLVMPPLSTFVSPDSFLIFRLV